MANSARNALGYVQAGGIKSNLAVSVHIIEQDLYLGNVACTRDQAILKDLKITHVLTVDLVPVQDSLKLMNVTYHFLKLADVPDEDLISILPGAIMFIKEALINGGTVLVHCYFGVSRSAAVIIAYIMERHNVPYDTACALVKNKRSFISPNVGFVSQLKLFGIMKYRLDCQNKTFKQFRLRMAGQRLKQVKILPLMFHDLIKPDPGVPQEHPESIVYRCCKCRRIVAGHSNIIPHVPKFARNGLAEDALPEVTASTSTAADKPHPRNTPRTLMARLKLLAESVIDGTHSKVVEDDGPIHLDGYNEGNLVDMSVTGLTGPDTCKLMWFVEPMEWMQGLITNAQGKLHCPKCKSKLGSYSWVSGVRCPCGQKVAPAFYLVPSKVEYSSMVRNVVHTV